jgi:hypothetical protein
MCGSGFWRFQRFFFYIIAVFLILGPMSGRTPLWSQSSEPLSNNSAGHLTAWEALSSKFTLDLERHEQTLKELGQKLGTSEASLQRLMPLYELSLQQNESLKTYNGQIAERMQERDEDLAASYEANSRMARTILRLVVAIILLGIPYLIKLALWAAKKIKA